MRTFLIIIVIFFASYARAQEANDVFIERTTAFAIGKTQRLDTYLSQEEYSGTDYRFISNVLRIRPNKWDFQFTHEGALDYTHNRVENANTLAGHYDFAFAMMKRLDKFENGPFTLRAGIMSDLYVILSQMNVAVKKFKAALTREPFGKGFVFAADQDLSFTPTFQKFR